MSADPFRDRTEQSDGSYPDSWPRPEAGDYIIGEVTAIEMSVGKYEQPVLAIMCEDSEKEFSVWLPKHIGNDILDQKLQVGERVSLKYHGVKEGKNNSYHNWKLMIDPKSRIAAPVAAEDPRTDEERYDEVQDRAFGKPDDKEAPAHAGFQDDDDELPF